jgi:hypothetical protein
MKDLKELLGAKKSIDPIEKEAKLAAVKGMRKMAGDMMADDMKSMKKVTVAAPDQEGLEMGLEKAQDVVEEMPEMEDESPEDGMMEVVESCETPEDIDKLIAKLNEKKLELAKG